jgi:hypothetical protein
MSQLVSELVRGPLRLVVASYCCKKLVAEFGNPDQGERPPFSAKTTTAEDTAS